MGSIFGGRYLIDFIEVIYYIQQVYLVISYEQEFSLFNLYTFTRISLKGNCNMFACSCSLAEKCCFEFEYTNVPFTIWTHM